MALTAGQDTSLDPPERASVVLPRTPPTAMPINPVEREKRLHRSLSQRAGDLLHTTKRSATRFYDEARARTAVGYSRVSEKTKDLTVQTRHAARYARQEHPVKLIGVLAGAAFVVGVALRIWRSQA